MNIPGVGAHVGIGEETRPLVESALEALGGSLPGTSRRPVTPIRWVLPPAVGQAVTAVDSAVDRAFATLRGHPGADWVFYSASTAADFSVMWHVIGWGRAGLDSRRRQEAARLSVALILDSVLVNAGVKSLFRRTRPPREEHRYLHLRRPRSSSFPSGHATSAFLAATLLADADRRGRGRTAAWYGLATVVATSRIHVGIHHASDVIVGALVGTGFGRLTLRLWPVPAPAPTDGPVAATENSSTKGPADRGSAGR